MVRHRCRPRCGRGRMHHRSALLRSDVGVPRGTAGSGPAGLIVTSCRRYGQWIRVVLWWRGTPPLSRCVMRVVVGRMSDGSMCFPATGAPSGGLPSYSEHRCQAGIAMDLRCDREGVEGVLRRDIDPRREGCCKARATPLNHAADGLRVAEHIHAAQESAWRAVSSAAEFPDGRGPEQSFSWFVPARHTPQDSAEEFLRGIYGDLYHTDGSPLARAYAHSMVSVPEELHRRVATHMREKPHGGIWVSDSGLSNFDHSVWSTAARGKGPQSWSAGSTWDDVDGAYDAAHRALFLGRSLRYPEGRETVSVHEIGHALGWPSQAPAFAEVYSRVISSLEKESAHIVADFKHPGGVGKAELFGEGLAWNYCTGQSEGFSWFESPQPAFLNSVAAGHYLTGYYRRLESKLGIAT